MFILDRLKLRWKLLLMIMPLVLLPMVMATLLIGYVAIRQIYQEVDEANRADLEHMSVFTIDLLNNYHRQRETFLAELQEERRRKLKDLVQLASRLVESHYRRAEEGDLTAEQARTFAYKSLKMAETGAFGYFYVMNSLGDLIVHIDREGENVIELRDENGRRFIDEICTKAIHSGSRETLFITYPWQNAKSGPVREKEVAYRYFKPWDWIIAAGSYVGEHPVVPLMESDEFKDLRKQITGKATNRSGMIYVTDCSGNMVLHSEESRKTVNQLFDPQGLELLQSVCSEKKKSAWLSYHPRFDKSKGGKMLARLNYFSPWDWVVVVEMGENELVGPAQAITGRILATMAFMIIVVGALAVMLAFLAAKTFTDPILSMTSAMRRVKSGRLEERLPVSTQDELGEMAAAFNQMTEMLKRDLALEEKLTEQQKMASLGVFSAEVAHEINNPMGIILGYACHLETKMDPDDPRYHFVQEIRSESKRCVGILSDLLRYARLPDPEYQPTDLGYFIDQIMEFAAGHKDLRNVVFKKVISETLPEVMIDRDQIRQVVMNLAINGAAAMPDGGEIVLKINGFGRDHVVISFIDSGTGIDPANSEKIFEPFFSTRRRGTGLGLAISKQIVEAHLGTIEIHSTPGKGTEVRVCLPVKQE